MALVNNEYDDLFDHWGRVFDVNPQLGKTVFHIESAANPATRDSKAGAKGGMQIMPKTAAGLDITNPNDMTQAIPAAMRYLREGLDATGTPEGALAYYNGGPRSLQGWKPETQGYVAEGRKRYPQMAVKTKDEGDDILRAFTTPARKATDAPKAQDTPAAKEEDGTDILTAFTSRAKPAEMSAPQTTPNDISGEGRDEWGNPLQPLASAARSEVSNPRDMGQATRETIKEAVRQAANTITNVQIPDGMGGTPVGALSIGAAAPAMGAVANAATSGFGPKPLGMNNRLVAALRQGGIYPPEQGRGTPVQMLNEGVMTPLGMVADAGSRGAGAAFRGGQEVVAQTGAALGAPGLGRDLAAMPEAFMGSPGHFQGPPVNRLTPGNNPKFVSEHFAPAAIAGQSTLDRIGQLIRHDDAEAGLQPPDAAPVNQLVAPQSGGSVGAAASREQSPPGTIDLTPKETAAYRATAETQKLIEPQPVGRDPTLYIQGVNPTQAHIEQSANVSREAKMLESAIPEEAKTVAKEHNEARQRHFSQLAGSEVDIANAEAARGAQATTDLAATWKNKTDANAQPVLDAMAQIVASPDGRRPLVRNAMKSVADELAPDGKPLTDPEQLYGVRKHIDDMLSKEAGRDDAKSQRAAANLMEVKKVLDGVIETAAPGFRQYLDNFAQASKPIDTMRVLQSYEPKLIDTQGRMQLSRVQKMMSDIVASRKADGINPYKSIPDEMLAPAGPLWALRDDLRRVASADELARAKGSDTVQNAMDVAKDIGKAGIAAAAHGAANVVLPVGGSFVLNAITNKLAGGRMQKRAANMLRPDPTQYRPLNSPD